MIRMATLTLVMMSLLAPALASAWGRNPEVRNLYFLPGACEAPNLLRVGYWNETLKRVSLLPGFTSMPTGGCIQVNMATAPAYYACCVDPTGAKSPACTATDIKKPSPDGAQCTERFFANGIKMPKP